MNSFICSFVTFETVWKAPSRQQCYDYWAVLEDAFKLQSKSSDTMEKGCPEAKGGLVANPILSSFLLFYITGILQAGVWLYDPLRVLQHSYFDYEGDTTVCNID